MVGSVLRPESRFVKDSQQNQLYTEKNMSAVQYEFEVQVSEKGLYRQIFFYVCELEQ